MDFRLISQCYVEKLPLCKLAFICSEIIELCYR